MLATLANASGDNWVELLPLVQLAHNTAYIKTLHETLHFLMFGRRATLPIDIILGVPTDSASQSRQRQDYPAVPLRIFSQRMKLHAEI